jgi:hypothetical protein
MKFIYYFCIFGSIYRFANCQRAATETRLRAMLKNASDPIVPPDGPNSGPIDVITEMNVFKIKDMSIATMTMEINAWLRLSWTDSRLTWDPSDYDMIKQTTFVAETVSQSSEIWVPDLEMYNHEVSVYDVSRKSCQVWYNGSVFWSRPSVYKVICSYTNVGNFPYDTLSCIMDFGGWSTSGLYVNYVAGELQFRGTTAVNDKYAEFQADTHKSAVYSSTFYYPCCPNEPWPVVSFKIAATRSSNPYTKGIVAPNIVVTFLSFGTLWMDPACGERMGYSATLLLALVAIDFITSSYLPMTDEFLWIELLSGWSMIMTALSTLLSLISLYFYFKWLRYDNRIMRQEESLSRKESGEDGGWRDYLVEMENVSKSSRRRSSFFGINKGEKRVNETPNIKTSEIILKRKLRGSLYNISTSSIDQQNLNNFNLGSRSSGFGGSGNIDQHSSLLGSSYSQNALKHRPNRTKEQLQEIVMGAKPGSARGHASLAAEFAKRNGVNNDGIEKKHASTRIPTFGAILENESLKLNNDNDNEINNNSNNDYEIEVGRRHDDKNLHNSIENTVKDNEIQLDLENEVLLQRLMPVRICGRLYPHWGKVVDVYARIILPALYTIILAYLYLFVLDNDDAEVA